MSLATDIADAVVADLNAHTFTIAFTSARKWLAELKLAEVSDTLHVTIVPGTLAQTPATRTKRQADCQIQIGVRKRPPSLADAAGHVKNSLIDPLANLVQEIDDFLATQQTLTTLAGVVWIASELTLPFSAEHLASWNQFTSVLTLTYRNWR